MRTETGGSPQPGCTTRPPPAPPCRKARSHPLTSIFRSALSTPSAMRPRRPTTIPRHRPAGKHGRIRSLLSSAALCRPLRQFDHGGLRRSPGTALQESTVASAHFYLPQRFVDPFGNATTAAYDDPHDLLVISTTDAVGNVVQAQNDYRVLAPVLVTDANGNQTAAQFDALGLMAGTAVMGKAGQNIGDSFTTFTVDLTQAQIDAFFTAADPHTLAAALLGTATTRIIYNLQQYVESSQAAPTNPAAWQPVFAATLAREIHESDLKAGAVSPIQVNFSYSDGFGREIQKKLQADPGPVTDGGPVVNPRWIGSGWTIFNNKGKPVRQYDPFFSNPPRSPPRLELPS